MAKKKDILRLHFEGVSQNEICETLMCSKTTVSKAVKAARDLQMNWVTLAELCEDDICQCLDPKPQHNAEYNVPDFDYIHKELEKPGVTMSLLWLEYTETHKNSALQVYQYSQYCKLFRNWAHKNNVTMHIVHIPARVCQFDWVGATAEVFDMVTGAANKAYLFVACLPYSQLYYVEAFPNMKQQSWIDAHIHAFDYFGGLPEFLVPDNLKTGVVHASFYEPMLNKTYLEFAEHYGCAILPARIRRPRDKGATENTVKIVETWIIARLRNERFFSFTSLNEAVRELLDKLNSAPFTSKEGSRIEAYLTEEKPAMRPLPPLHYELYELRHAKVASDHHIQVDYMRYSVHYSYVGDSVEVRLTANVVEVYKNNQRLCSHRRLYGKRGQYSTIDEHVPESHKLYQQEWNPDRIRRWANSIGPNTADVIEAIFASRTVITQTYRSCLGVLRFATKDSKEMLEDACMRALSLSSCPSYTQIRNILIAMRREQKNHQPDSDSLVDGTIDESGFTRGSDYYRLDGDGDDQQ